MRKSKAGWLAAALLGLALLPMQVTGQERGTVAGTVVDESTNEPLAGVQISITGTQLGTITNNDGRFLLVNVPAGMREVRATSIGYSAGLQTVQVNAGETATVDFRLATSAVALEEIIVTGTVGAVQRREQPAVVATINAAEQTERGTSTNVTDLLTARVPGVAVTNSSGTTGTAQQIRIRGASSITLSNEPLVFIDGIKASNRTLTDINIGGQGVSQLFDINPEDIESIEVVKGPAAATLYGADASAGVIQIITKQGRPGANKYTQTISLEYNQLEHNWTPPLNWYACSADDVEADSGVEFCAGQSVGTLLSDQPLVRNNTFRDGHMRSLGYSGRGGGENYGYYVSLGWDDEEATLPNNALDRKSGRVNFTFVPRSDLRFEAGLAIGNTESTFPINDNNIFGFLGGGMLGDPSSLFTADDGSLRGGWYIPTRDEAAITNIESAIETLRYTPSLTSSYTPTDWFTNRLTLGADVSRTQGTQFFPRNNLQWYGGDTDTGDLEEERINFDVYTVDYLGTFSTLFGSNDEFKADFSVGFQAIAEIMDNVAGFGTNFVTNANRVIGDAVQISADQDWQKTTSIGYLGQANLGFWDRLYVQLGARVDQFSSFGEKADPFFLPQAGVSYVISDESFWDPIASIVPSMRLRVAYGTTGRAPSAGAALETYSAQPYAIIPGESGSGVTPDRPGNFDLKPERGTEYEAGFEAGFFDQRLGLDVTYFHKRTTDLILTVPVPPSSGFSSNPFRNIGEVLNKGWEVAVRGTPVSMETSAGAST
ncbi:MAG: SusC/RagA family TonB-linked outer membrane protein [Longimicrobiales bacterium]